MILEHALAFIFPQHNRWHCFYSANTFGPLFCRLPDPTKALNNDTIPCPFQVFIFFFLRPNRRKKSLLVRCTHIMYPPNPKRSHQTFRPRQTLNRNRTFSFLLIFFFVSSIEYDFHAHIFHIRDMVFLVTANRSSSNDIHTAHSQFMIITLKRKSRVVKPFRCDRNIMSTSVFRVRTSTDVRTILKAAVVWIERGSPCRVDGWGESSMNAHRMSGTDDVGRGTVKGGEWNSGEKTEKTEKERAKPLVFIAWKVPLVAQNRNIARLALLIIESSFSYRMSIFLQIGDY